MFINSFTFHSVIITNSRHKSYQKTQLDKPLKQTKKRKAIWLFLINLSYDELTPYALIQQDQDLQDQDRIVPFLPYRLYEVILY